MTVISSTKNPEALSFTLVAEFDAGVERVWQIWEDPRQLERWWGPPTWPATFEQLEFRPAESRLLHDRPGRDEGPRLVAVHVHPGAEPAGVRRRLRGRKRDPVEDMGTTHATVTLEDLGGRTRMTVLSTFESEEQMNKMVEMGMEEGMKEAAGQIDALLAEHARA